MKKPLAIRENDVVRIVRPEFVTRVGYPKSVDDYLTQDVMKEAQDFLAKYDPNMHKARPRMFGSQSIGIMDLTKSARRIAREIAYTLARADGFGGRERKLYTVVIPEAKDVEVYVHGVRSVQTGQYYPPVKSSDWETGYVEWDPGGLDGRQTHRLLRVDTPFRLFEMQKLGGSIEIERKNVEFVKRLS